MKLTRETPAVKKEFSRYQAAYYLDKDNRLKRKPTDKDCQAVIDSCKETTLDAILDKFGIAPFTDLMSGVPEIVDEYIGERMTLETDLDIFMKADEILDDYRVKYGKPNLTRDQVIEEIRANISEYGQKINAEKEKQHEKENASVSPKKQEEFPSDGSQSASEKST